MWFWRRNPTQFAGQTWHSGALNASLNSREGDFLIPPDLAVEVMSPDDRRKDLRAKIKEYLFYSVPLIWLVDPDTRTVTVYRGNMRGTEYDENDTLDGGDVLPGFSCKVSDLFA